MLSTIGLPPSHIGNITVGAYMADDAINGFLPIFAVLHEVVPSLRRLVATICDQMVLDWFLGCLTTPCGGIVL